MAKGLISGDLVSDPSRTDELFVVIGFTYRVSQWGNRRLMKLFCSSTGRVELILEERLVVISPANSEKSS
jgi:hypothetical protein